MQSHKVCYSNGSEVLSSNLMYQEVLESGIANLTAMANRIKAEVENKVHSHVNTSTIVAALKRVVDNKPATSNLEYECH